MKAVVRKANPQSAAGPSGQCYSHLQAALCDELVDDLAAFETLVFSSRVLPQAFSTLHTSASLSALGQKARQWRAVMTCGELLAPFSAADTAESWQTTSSPGVSTA